jgi:hypothetical protein
MQKLMQRRQAEEVSAAGKTYSLYRVSFGHPTQGLPLLTPEGQSFLLQP